MRIALALVAVILTACAPEYREADGAIEVSMSAPLVAAPHQYLSWVGRPAPFAVTLPELDERQSRAAHNALAYLNEWAGADVFVVRGAGDVRAELVDGDDGWIGCSGTCDMEIGAESADSVVMWLHELIHMTGYRGNVDGVHDDHGIMAGGGDLTVTTEVLPTVIEHLQAVAAEMRVAQANE